MVVRRWTRAITIARDISIQYAVFGMRASSASRVVVSLSHLNKRTHPASMPWHALARSVVLGIAADDARDLAEQKKNETEVHLLASASNGSVSQSLRSETAKNVDSHCIRSHEYVNRTKTSRSVKKHVLEIVKNDGIHFGSANWASSISLEEQFTTLGADTLVRSRHHNRSRESDNCRRKDLRFAVDESRGLFLRHTDNAQVFRTPLPQRLYRQQMAEVSMVRCVYSAA